jgi:hypothetical protein
MTGPSGRKPATAKPVRAPVPRRGKDDEAFSRLEHKGELASYVIKQRVM